MAKSNFNQTATTDKFKDKLGRNERWNISVDYGRINKSPDNNTDMSIYESILEME